MQNFLEQLNAGHLTAVTVVAWTVLAAIFATLGGALAGIRLAGKDLGNALAASMGAMFGPTAAVPGVLLGLIALAFFL